MTIVENKGAKMLPIKKVKSIKKILILRIISYVYDILIGWVSVKT